MNRKFQVFIGSTYEDLIEERKAVIQALLESNCIPAGMEMFPGSYRRSWDIIKRTIDESDFYLLIIAGRYGSNRRNGKTSISYTESEFNYALKTKKFVIAFMNDTPIKEMQASKIEETAEGKSRLERFKTKVKKEAGNLAFWTDKAGLVSAVKSSVQQAMNDTPDAGWIKGSELGEGSVDENIKKYQNVIERWGMEKVFRTRAEKNAESDLMLESHDIKQLDGIAFGLRSFRTARSKDVLECLQNGMAMRLLVMNPDSRFVTQRAIEENEEPDSIRRSIINLQKWAEELNAKSRKGKINIKYYDCMTLEFYWRIDDVIYVGPYWYDTLSQQTITYKFNSSGLGFSHYTSYFDKLWNMW